jgi:hypothetical protein
MRAQLRITEPKCTDHRPGRADLNLGTAGPLKAPACTRDGRFLDTDVARPSETSPMARSIEELSFGLSRDALAAQERAIAELRARAGTVLATASAAASFLASRAGRGGLPLSTAAALACFAGGAGSALWVLLPHRLPFTIDGDAALSTVAVDGRTTLNEAYLATAAWMRPGLATTPRLLDSLRGLSRVVRCSPPRSSCGPSASPSSPGQWPWTAIQAFRIAPARESRLTCLRRRRQGSFATNSHSALFSPR